MGMSMQFIKAGLQTSIQDLGRFGQMHNGVSQSGAMDPISMQMANWLVGKPLDAAVIEISLVGPTIQFNSEQTIAICGAEFSVFLNSNEVFNDRSFNVVSGDVLEFSSLKSGVRAYLAFSGELDLPMVLSSYSTHLTANFGGFKGRQFQAGDRLRLTSVISTVDRQLPIQNSHFYSGSYLLRTVRTIESDRFNEAQLHDFYAQSFMVTPQSNRMGIRLNPEKPVTSLIIDKVNQIVSSGLVQGSIQIPPSGDPIISSVDGQTIGGYPRIANIITADLPLLGQLNAHDKVRFVLIDKNEALAILRQKQLLFEFLNLV